MINQTKAKKFKLKRIQEPFKEFQEYNLSNQSQVMFLRYVGIETSEDDYTNNLRSLDQVLSKKESNYIKITKGLEPCRDPKRIETMKKIADQYFQWELEDYLRTFYHLELGYSIPDASLEWTKKRAFKDILDAYRKDYKPNPSNEKNFAVKLLFWMNHYLKKLYENQTLEGKKVLFYGSIKKHESYFLMLLSRLGCDVIYINPKEDILVPSVQASSQLKQYRKLSSIVEFPKKIIERKETPVKQEVMKQEPVRQETHPIQRVTNNNRRITNAPRPIQGQELSYEELALFSESVVMIKVLDRRKEIIGAGSGVVINDTGFILTNFHVVQGGAAFEVIFENDSQSYYTTSIIKYNQDYDLALISVQRRTKAIKLSNKALVRGQKIISIGSPLGLFNTISDGIVSGFRPFNHCDMVQITAPISPGSSGGALLNMYGELVGITTAAFQGQNLNLAVPKKHIYEFACNILKP